MRIIAVVLGVLLALPVWSAGVYRWTDENGRVHYGDRPPGQGSGQTVKVPKSSGSGSSAAPSSEDRQKAMQQYLEEADYERQKKRAAQQKRDQARDKLDSKCKVVKKELEDTLQHPRLYDYDQNGERYFLSGAQRDAHIQREQNWIRENCG